MTDTLKAARFSPREVRSGQNLGALGAVEKHASRLARKFWGRKEVERELVGFAVLNSGFDSFTPLYRHLTGATRESIYEWEEIVL